MHSASTNPASHLHCSVQNFWPPPVGVNSVLQLAQILSRNPPRLVRARLAAAAHASVQ
jgi:hypothetical protein